MRHTNPIDHAALFVHDESDENGNRRRVTILPEPMQSRVPRLTVLAVTLDSPLERRAVWKNNPCCVNCEAWIDSPDASGIIPTDSGPRLACRSVCFAEAMTKHHPQLAIRAALGRVGRNS